MGDAAGAELPSRGGRRPGHSGSREAILAAARVGFAARGFDRTTIRSVAQVAEVDPALVLHFFGSKQALFQAALRLPVDISALLPQILGGDVGSVGRRLAETVLATLADPVAGAQIEAMIRSAASEPTAVELLREVVAQHLQSPIAEVLRARYPDDAHDPLLRANLVGSTMVGLVFARRLVATEPLASRSDEQVAALLGPVLQHYLLGDLTAESTDSPTAPANISG